MYPTCAMDEYASRRLVLVCVSAAKFAPVMVAIETKTRIGTHTLRIEISPHGWKGLPKQDAQEHGPSGGLHRDGHESGDAGGRAFIRVRSPLVKGNCGDLE